MIPTVLGRRQALRAAVATALLVAKGRHAHAKAPVRLGPTMKPAELARRLGEVEAGRLVVLFVGPPGHFEEGHVPGARRLPHVGTAEGKAALARELETTPPDIGIVVYCGCCPYTRCPSVRPANAILREARREGARWLDMPTSFEKDWAARGFPVATG